MNGAEGFLWTAIISSTIVLLGYEIWNFIVVVKDFASMAKAARTENVPS